MSQRRYEYRVITYRTSDLEKGLCMQGLEGFKPVHQTPPTPRAGLYEVTLTLEREIKEVLTINENSLSQDNIDLIRDALNHYWIDANILISNNFKYICNSNTDRQPLGDIEKSNLKKRLESIGKLMFKI